jgi:hypothetical protein
VLAGTVPGLPRALHRAMTRLKRVRSERDPIGERAVPDQALYGVQTLRDVLHEEEE